MSGKLGQRLGRFVGLDQPPTLTTRYLQLAEISGSRHCWDGSEAAAPVRMETSNGYLLCLQRRELPAIPYWVNGKPVSMMPLNRGQFLFLDLNEEHASVTRGTVDCVSMYAPRAAIRQFEHEHDMKSVGELRTANGVAFSDNVIRHLGACLAPAFERPETTSRLFVDYIALALLTHLTTHYAENPAVARPIGGLAPWQERRAKEMLLAHLDGKIGLDELARACRLSRSHFARAFKATTGSSPLQWLLGRRIERAQELLGNSELPIEQIASRCGFTDQSHLTRSFVKAMNVTPSHWRRLRLA
ncbi:MULTISPECIES: AraC family transcriptional regulator [Sinorhizobium]|uniref:helix-turn-helix domain-containing protein n=1 Tax=Sinorhizobium TaxID=28105 RepID=UPI000BE7C582|nr:MULTISPECIES: AraC family transcriptional regulator [Sinorhizobium]PDT52528.1 AraC family transcriptional regulator [Sinorhizobium sp. NG07B]POH28255.1 transcriptional regulator [Sinorhizobium americanum]